VVLEAKMDYFLQILFFAVISLLAGVILTVAGRFFRVFVDNRVEKLTEQFPGLNCGACGFASCERYALAIVEKDIPANQCKPGGIEVAEKIGEVLGKTVEAALPEVAFVHCAGTCTRKYRYRGTQSCRAASFYYNGKEECSFACAGLGDCVEVCPENAISIVNRRAVVAINKCNACGLCIKACPKNIITIQKAHQTVSVTCCSKDTGKITKSFCSTGCIGCRICEKRCLQKAIIVKENLAVINPDLCNSCGNCVGYCPVKCISLRKDCDAKGGKS
jgi:Na+-translocating ferredoxin:NAD+ oxidoreductase RNF subunit RnfB